MNPHLTSIWTAGAALTSNLRESALMGEGTFNSKTPRPVGPAPSGKKSSAAFNAAKKSQAGKYWGDTKPVK
jgi:hypothetical protein